uniref:Uncharacterized protein n=1 Tax=Acrobeloides nanus TaxID=290746 RepID=A0A914EQC9_9BILA
MLRRLESAFELEQALNETMDLPELRQIHCSIQTMLLNRFPASPSSLFVHENPSGYKLWVILRVNIYTVAKLKYMPYSIIRKEGEPNPVAFELMDPSGFLNHHYTQLEHRRKGLGAAVELDLAQNSLR